MLRQAPPPQVQQYHQLVNELRVAQQDALRAGDKPPGCAVFRSSGEREMDWTVAGFRGKDYNVVLSKKDPSGGLEKEVPLEEFARWQCQLCLEAKTQALTLRSGTPQGIQGTIKHTIADLRGAPKYLIPIADAYLQNTSEGGESHILPPLKEPMTPEEYKRLRDMGAFDAISEK